MTSVRLADLAGAPPPHGWAQPGIPGGCFGFKLCGSRGTVPSPLGVILHLGVSRETSRGRKIVPRSWPLQGAGKQARRKATTAAGAEEG